MVIFALRTGRTLLSNCFHKYLSPSKKAVRVLLKAQKIEKGFEILIKRKNNGLQLSALLPAVVDWQLVVRAINTINSHIEPAIMGK